jgi:hypothetical protein
VANGALSGVLWTRTATSSIAWSKRCRDTAAATEFCPTRLKVSTDVPRMIITDQLTSDGPATLEGWPGVEHRQQRSRNARAAHAPQPIRQPAQRMRRGNSPRHAPWSLATCGPIASPIRPRRQRFSASAYHHEMTPRCQRWQELTGTTAAASGNTGGMAVPLEAVWCDVRGFLMGATDLLPLNRDGATAVKRFQGGLDRLVAHAKPLQRRD